LVTIRFELPLLHPGVTIPAGTRVASADGIAVFRTQADITVISNFPWAEAVCVSVTPGANFNGYSIGTINNILDPVAYVNSAANVDESAGGSDIETDDQLRARARLAPDAFGTAGSRNAYKYWTYTANPGIIDVGVDVVPTNPGTVIVYPLLESGTVPTQPVLDAVFAVLDADEVRPLTDTVQVVAPTQVSYTLDIGIVIYETADPVTVAASVETAVEAYVLQQRQRMGRDIMSDQLIAACMVDGVYDVDLGAFTDIIIDSNEYGFCNNIDITVTGTNEG